MARPLNLAGEVPRPKRAMSNSLRINILTRDGYSCQYCRAPEVELHVEHIRSVHDGGANHPSNLVAARVDCNYGKGKRSLIIEQTSSEPSIFFLDFVPDPLPPAQPVPIPLPRFRGRALEPMLELVRAAADTAFFREYLRGGKPQDVDDPMDHFYSGDDTEPIREEDIFGDEA